MTQARSAPASGASAATPGVGSTPAVSASPPAATMPSTSARSRAGPLSRVSRPSTIRAPGPAVRAAAAPSARASSSVRSTPAMPRTPSVPNSLRTVLTGRGSALRELRALAGLLQPGLLALHDARVARQEPGLLQVGPQVLIRVHQRPGDAVAQRASLTGNAAAVDPGADVKGSLGTAHAQRRRGDGLQDLAREEGRQRLAVHGDLAAAGDEHDAGHGVLALSRAAVHGVGAHERSSIGTGFWDECGCSGPA